MDYHHLEMGFRALAKRRPIQSNPSKQASKYQIADGLQYLLALVAFAWMR